MPTLGAKEDASLHSTTPFHVGENEASSRSPVEAPSLVVGGPVSAQEVTENGAVPVPQVHPLEEFSKDPQVQNIEAFCNNCLLKVAGSEALGHLYFGTLKCANCLYVINQCKDFKTYFPPREKCRKNFLHHVMTQWEQPVWSYLTYCARRNFIISRFIENDNASATMRELQFTIVSYLKALKPLKDIEPWKRAFEDPLVIKNIELSIPEVQLKVPKMHERDKPVEKDEKAEHAIQQRTQSTTSVTQSTQTSEAQDKKVQCQKSTPSSSSAAQSTQTSEPQDKKAQEKRAKHMYQKSASSSSSTAQPTQTSEPQDKKVQEKRAKDTYQQIAPLTSSVTQTTQKSSFQKRKVQQKTPNQHNTPLASSATQTTQKSKLEDTKIQQDRTRGGKQDGTPLTSPATQPTQKSSTQKRKVQKDKPKSENQQSAPLTSPVTQTTQNSKPQRKKMQSSRTKDADQHSTSSTISAKHMTQTSKLTEEKSTDLSPTKNETKSGKKKDLQYSEFIPKNVLNSGYYLVVQHPGQECPEECPNCYYPFEPEMCIVNLSTFITNFICPNCYLSVYVVPKQFYDKQAEHKPAEQSLAVVRVDRTHAKKIKCEV